MMISVNQVLATPVEKLANEFNMDLADAESIKELAKSYWYEPETFKALNDKANELVVYYNSKEC